MSGGKPDLSSGVDPLVVAARNRLPGQDVAGWASEIRELGLSFARTVLSVRMGEAPLALTAEDLVWAGMADELAEDLIPDLSQDDTYLVLYRRLEALRDAARQLAAPEVVAALPPTSIGPPAYVEQLGSLLPVFAGEFMTVQEACAVVPDFEQELDRQMAALARVATPAPGERIERHALVGLEGKGWQRVTQLGPILLLANPSMGILVLAATEATAAQVQAAVNHIVEIGTPLVQVAIEQGAHPVYTAQPAGGTWLLDGERQPAGKSLADCISEPPGIASGMVRSLVGQVHAGALGVRTPQWVHCPACNSPRVEVIRLEIERGFSTLQIVDATADFPTRSGPGLRVVGRKPGKKQVYARALRCPDCFATRPFPGEEPMIAETLPKRMAGEEIPRGINPWIVESTGLPRPLGDTRVPESVEEWVRAHPKSSTAQYADLRLTVRTAFRLPDQLVDLGRSVPPGGTAALSAWREAAGRLGRREERLLAWELRDLGNANDGVRRLVVVGIDPAFIAAAAEAWFGPVDEWVAVTPKTCWRGRMIGTKVPIEIVLIQDFLGAPGEYAGGENDYEFLSQIARHATTCVYAGDGRLEWDDEGIQWAADEGRLSAVIAPAAQLALAARPDDVAWIDATLRGAEDDLFEAVTAAVDPQTRVALKGVRDVIAEIEKAVPPSEMADHLMSVHLRTLAVQAELSDSHDAWLVLWDAICDTLAAEGRSSHVDRRVRSSVAARILAEQGLPSDVADGWWQLVEFYERTGIGKPMVQWLAPVMATHPDTILLERLKAVAARMPDLIVRYKAIREMRADLAAGRSVAPKRHVLEFWWGCGAPVVWPAEPHSLPDLLSFAPSHIRNKSAVFVGGPSLRSGQRLAVLLTGLMANEEYAVPDPGNNVPTVVMEPRKVDLVRLEARSNAGHLTVIVEQDDPRKWANAMDGNVGIVPLSAELSVQGPSVHDMSRRLPHLDQGDLAEVCALMHTMAFEAGEVVIRAGTPLGAAAWIRSGTVELYGGIEAGQDAMIGGERLFDFGPYPEDVVATSPLVLDVISKSALRALLAVGRRAVTDIEHAAASSMARLLGPGRIEPGWFTPRTLTPQDFNGDWNLYWPLLQRNGFEGADPKAVQRTFPDLKVKTLAAKGVVYEPHAEAKELILVLDGTLLLDDGQSKTELGPGRYAGTLGMRDDPGHERCMTIEETVVLYLGGDPSRVWSSPDRAFRLAMIHTLRERLVSRNR